MEKTILYKNISKYILGQDHVNPNEYDFTNFSITDFDYRKLFEGNNFVTNDELSHKFFGTEREFHLDTIYNIFREYIKAGRLHWKIAFIFFMTLPYTEYEFVEENGDIIDPDNLDKATDSQASDNILLGTFLKIDFIDNREMPQKRFDSTLKRILDTDIFSEDLYTNEQREDIILLLLRLRFTQEHEYVEGIKKQCELTFCKTFGKYLFDPIFEFVASLQHTEICIASRNNFGPTGVDTKVPHQTNGIFYSYPDICAYLRKNTKNTLVIVEVKKMPLFIHNKLNFNNPLTNSFFVQLISEMFSNRKNKGILTDSNTTVLVEIDLERTRILRNENRESQAKRTKYSSNNVSKKTNLGSSGSSVLSQIQEEIVEGSKKVSLNYKIVNLHSSGLTMMGALTSFIYEAFEGNDHAKEANELYEVYQYIRKTDEEYLEYLTKEANKVVSSYRSMCKVMSII